MASNTSNQKFLVLTCLTGADAQKVQAQTQQLQPPVPNEGSAEYQTFVSNLSKSPANVVSSLAQFLQDKAAWNIQSDGNFQDYINLYNDAPFVIGFSGGTTQVLNNVHNIDDLISGIMDTAGVPQEDRADVSQQLDLENWFSGDFEDDPKSLQVIIQNMVAANGQIQLLWTNASLTISYYPPEKKGILIKKPTDPTYKLSGSITHASATGQAASWFAANAGQFLALGFTNVTDWLKNNSTQAVTV